MRPIRIPPVPAALPRPAAATSCPDSGCRGWFAAVDGFVLEIYRTGFVQSLILHMAVLLALALIVIVPDLRTPATIALQFTPVTPEAEPDLAAVELPAPEVEPPEPSAEPEPLPHVEVAAAEVEIPGFDAVEPAAFTLEDPVAGIDATGLLVDVPMPAGRGAGRDDGPGTSEIGGEIGRRLRVAGAGTGDVQISIAWSNVNDIDLHVLVEPLDQRAGNSIINFMNRVGIAGGWLDVDHNVRPTTRTPVENVFWGRGAAPFGRYTVAVHHYRDWGGGNPTEVEVVTLVDGKENRFYVVLRPGEPLKVVTSFRRGPAGGAVGSAGFFPRPSMPLSRPIVRGRGPYVMPMPLK